MFPNIIKRGSMVLAGWLSSIPLKYIVTRGSPGAREPFSRPINNTRIVEKTLHNMIVIEEGDIHFVPTSLIIVFGMTSTILLVQHLVEGD